MKEFVFFSMIIIPVYMFSALLDAFIFNSIQFWSGGNPVKANDAGRSVASQVPVRVVNHVYDRSSRRSVRGC